MSSHPDRLHLCNTPELLEKTGGNLSPAELADAVRSWQLDRARKDEALLKIKHMTEELRVARYGK